MSTIPQSHGALALPEPAAPAPPFDSVDTLTPILCTSGGPGARLREIGGAAEIFRRELAATGVPRSVRSFDLVDVPYPTQFGLWRASEVTAPFLTLRNRMLVVRWNDGDGLRTLLFNPSDGPLDANTPYFQDLAARLTREEFRNLTRPHELATTVLERVGIAPEEVDYIAFDHLHTQDVRHWLGTTRPQQDISPDAPQPPVFPNATLLVQHEEWEALADLHPFQRPWYQPETYVDIPGERVTALAGDVILGPGVAIIRTPGHAAGNQSLVLNTDTGIWTCSENAIAAECVTPNLSEIPGVAAWAAHWQQEVVINANTLETAAEQYNSVLLEKSLADRSTVDERFVQFFPTSELTAVLPGAAEPTFVHGGITHGPDLDV